MMHLYHLMFNDALVMHLNGCNHNASDRSSVYDCWMDDVQAMDFGERFRAAKDKHDSSHQMNYDKLAEVTGVSVTERPIAEIEKYAEEMATRAIDMLEGDLSKLENKDSTDFDTRELGE